MPYDKRLVGDPETGVIHGGAVSALLDTCGGAAVMVHESLPVGTATLDLRIDYMRAGTPGKTLIAEAHAYKTTRHIAFVRAIAHDGDVNDPVATSQATFMTTARNSKHKGNPMARTQAVKDLPLAKKSTS